jgi:sulfopyruvate decarboxylase TPP-binding subunit
MKLTIEATGTIERVHGMPARVWQGRTESGIEVTCWIPIVRVRRDADCSEFERELKEIEVTRELVAFDMRMVL